MVCLCQLSDPLAVGSARPSSPSGQYLHPRSLVATTLHDAKIATYRILPEQSNYDHGVQYVKRELAREKAKLGNLRKPLREE